MIPKVKIREVATFIRGVSYKKDQATNIDSWTDQLGQLQSSVDYELTEGDFVDFASENRDDKR